MTPPHGGLTRRVIWRVLSVPISVKIVGIGAVVALFLGGARLLQSRGSTARIMQKFLKERTLSTARSVAAQVERPLVTGDFFSVRQKLVRSTKLQRDTIYIIVRDHRRRIVAHTFKGGVPADLAGAVPVPRDPDGVLQIFSSKAGQIFDATVPVLTGSAGTVTLGNSDSLIRRELSTLTRSALWTLGLCLILGIGMALLLTHVLAHPILQLVQAVKRIEEGDFQARADVLTGDEVGKLATAFNHMGQGLERYRVEVQSKDRARQRLVNRLVEAQEEERRAISRELHDELGQSLLAILVKLQASCKYRRSSENICAEIEVDMRRLVDDVRRLAWGIRPALLDDIGLESALRRLVEEKASRTSTVIDLQFSAPPAAARMPGRIEVSLYRAAQEALINVIKHAQAERVSVVLLRRAGTATLLVEDDGRGFDPAKEKRRPEPGLGLTGMQERAALCGGVCTIESTPGEGTTVRVKVDLNAGQHANPNPDS